MAESVCRTRDDLLATLERDIGTIAGISAIETMYYLRLLYRSAVGVWGAARSQTARLCEEGLA